jgi:DNA (cytosine-5)-methyltransferase 1
MEQAKVKKQKYFHGTLFSEPKAKKQNAKFSFIDLFAGIGGFRLALEGLGGECVFSSEIDSECAKTYEANFGEYPNGDITKIEPKNIPNHDILCAGFPCQPFSISGKMKGFGDTRGILFFTILEIIKEKQPKVVFLENVKHLKDHDGKKTLKTIIQHLEELGYKTEWQILNAKDFGLAQNRERIIIIGNKKKRFNFSKIPKNESGIIKDILEDQADFEYLKPSEYTILPKNQWKRQKSGLIFCGYRNKSIRINGTRPNTKHLSRVHKQPNRIYLVDGTHPTIPSQETAGRFWIYDCETVRKLTLNECFKLQGFPEDFIKVSTPGTCYKQIGNAVAIPMIRGVGKQILAQLI